MGVTPIDSSIKLCGVFLCSTYTWQLLGTQPCLWDRRPGSHMLLWLLGARYCRCQLHAASLPEPETKTKHKQGEFRKPNHPWPNTQQSSVLSTHTKKIIPQEQKNDRTIPWKFWLLVSIINPQIQWCYKWWKQLESGHCADCCLGTTNHTTNRNQPSPKDSGSNRMPEAYRILTRIHPFAQTLLLFCNYTRRITCMKLGTTGN